MATSRPQVMILGAYHMDNPNLDYVKTNHADVLTEPRQAQIRDLVNRLQAFAPTHVAIEVPPVQMAKVNDQYQRYLQGEYALTRNEVDQVGFRLAQAMGHSRLHGVDYNQDIGMDRLFDGASSCSSAQGMRHCSGSFSGRRPRSSWSTPCISWHKEPKCGPQ